MTPNFNPRVYAERRGRVMTALGDGALVLTAAPSQHKSADQDFRYRASNDLVYLTGFIEPESVLVLVRAGESTRCTLFVRPRNKEREIWDGRRAGVDGAKRDFGVDEAFSVSELSDKLPQLLENQPRLFYGLNQHRPMDGVVFRALDKLRGGRGKADRRPDTIVDPARPLHALRRLKQPEEIDVLRTACAIATEAHSAAMKAVRPGMHEYEVAALIEHVFRRRGAEGPGYESICGGGANATILHYIDNADVLQDGTLLLIDAGCEYQFYNSDITRTFPVGDRFTPAQRDVYQAVLDVQKEACLMVRGDTSAHDLTVWSKRALSQKLIDLGLLNESLDTVLEEKLYERFYMHNLGHYLGMDVHDVGTYLVSDGEPLALQPGVVLTIEPGIYIPEDAEDVPKEMRGIGIRIEDDILCTDGEPENLTSGVPKEIDDIEALRRDACAQARE